MIASPIHRVSNAVCGIDKTRSSIERKKLEKTSRSLVICPPHATRNRSSSSDRASRRAAGESPLRRGNPAPIYRPPELATPAQLTRAPTRARSLSCSIPSLYLCLSLSSHRVCVCVYTSSCLPPFLPLSGNPPDALLSLSLVRETEPPPAALQHRALVTRI